MDSSRRLAPKCDCRRRRFEAVAAASVEGIRS